MPGPATENGSISRSTARPCRRGKPLTVNLCHAGSSAAVESVDTDQRGSFVLRIDAGTYDLHLHLPGGRHTVVPDIRLV